MVEAFHAHVALVRSRSTADAYRLWVRRFDKWLDETERDAQTDPNLIRDFVAGLLRNGNKVTTANVARVAVTTLLDWLRDHQGIAIAAQRPAEMPKASEPLTYVPTEADVAAFLAVAVKWRMPFGAIGALLPYCGLRISEMCAMRLSDAKWTGTRHLLTVRAPKNKQDREVPVVGDGNTILAEYLSDERPGLPGDDTDWLFPTKGEQPVQRKEAERQLRLMRDKASLPLLTHHSLRRFWATMMIGSGVEGATVAKMLGHKSMAVLGKYYRPSAAQLDRALNRANPDL